MHYSLQTGLKIAILPNVSAMPQMLDIYELVLSGEWRVESRSCVHIGGHSGHHLSFLHPPKNSSDIQFLKDKLSLTTNNINLKLLNII